MWFINLSQIRRSRLPLQDLLLIFAFLFCGLAWMLVDNRMFSGSWGVVAVDPWIYTGYIQSITNHLRNFPTAYYGTRLTYLAPGYILQLIFGAEFGGFLLRFMFYLLLILSAYFFYRSRHSIQDAAVLATCFLSSLLVVGVFVDDYISGPGLSTIIMSLFLLERAVVAKSLRWWFLTGVSIALMLYTNLFLVVFIPCFGIYWFLQDDWRGKLVYKQLFLILLGMITITALLGFMSWLWGGQFLFFLPNFDITKSVLGEKNPWNPEGGKWIWNAPWLALPLLGLLFSFRQFVSAGFRREWKTPRTAFSAANLAICLIFIAFQIKGQPILALGYYEVYLVPFGLVAIVDSILGDGRFTNLPSIRGLVAVPLALRMVALWLISVTLLYIMGFLLLRGGLLDLVQMLVPVIASSLLLILVSYWLGGYVRMMGLVLILSVLQLWIVVIKAPCSYWFAVPIRGLPSQPALGIKDCPAPRDLYHEVVELHKLIYQFSGGEKPAFWFDAYANPGLQALFNGVSGTFLWGYSIVAIDYPDLSEGVFGVPQMGLWSQDGILVVMFPAEKSLDEGIATLRQNGIDPEVIYQEDRELDGWHYVFAVLRRKTPDFETNMVRSVLLDWTAQDLREKASANYYGLLPLDKGNGLTLNGKELYFGTRDGKDHLAIPFLIFQIAPQDEHDLVLVQAIFGEAVSEKESPMMVLQDQNYDILSEMRPTCLKPDCEVLLYALVTSEIKSVRVIFYGEPFRSVLLPDRITIELVKAQ